MRLVPADGGGTGPGPLFAQVDRFLVPTGEPDLVAFFLRHLFVPHNARERLARGLLTALPPATAGQLLARSRRRLWRLAPDEAEPEHRGGEPAAGNLLVRAVALLDAALGSGADPRTGAHPGARWILLADYAHHRRRGAIAFLFPPGTRRPDAVVKLRPADGEGTALAREAGTLIELRGLLPAHLARTLPKPLGRWESSAGEALWLEALPGRSAYVEQAGSPLPARRVAGHLEAAATWLGRFHLATRSHEICSLPPTAGDLPAPSPGGTPAWYRDLTAELDREPLHLTAGHGDFWARNLLLPADGGELPGVVDWEGYRRAAPPWEDLFHFVLSYAFHHRWLGLRRRPPREAFRHAFVGGGFMFRRVRRYFQRYCAVTRIDPSLLAPLFRLYLLGREASASPTPGGAEPGNGGGEKGLFLWCYLALQGADRSAFSG